MPMTTFTHSSVIITSCHSGRHRTSVICGHSHNNMCCTGTKLLLYSIGWSATTTTTSMQQLAACVLLSKWKRNIGCGDDPGASALGGSSPQTAVARAHVPDQTQRGSNQGMQAKAPLSWNFREKFPLFSKKEGATNIHLLMTKNFYDVFADHFLKNGLWKF